MATYPLWGVVQGESVPRFHAEEFLLFPFVQNGQYPRQSSGGVWTLTATVGGIIFPVVVPHGLPPILKRLHSPHYAYCHNLTMVSPDLASNFILLIRKCISLVSSSRGPRGRQLRRDFGGALLNLGRPVRTRSGRGTLSI